MNAIDVRGLTKRFGTKTVVDNVDLDARRGEIVGFLGPNGSGKTTTIRMLCGLLRPDGGEGTCLGFDIRREAEQIKREIGYMTQRFSYYEDLTIRENLELVARLYDLKPARDIVRRVLKHLGLEDRQNQLAAHLSGGWKQRLALAACVMHRPKLLLLDEPTAGVDPQARREFWDEIHDLAAAGLTVLVSTHYMDEAERCHRIAYIFNGRLVTRGAVGEVIARSGLSTFVVHGASTTAMIDRLKLLPAAQQVSPFGTALHVTGTDRAALAQALTDFAQSNEVVVEPGETSLEDVFIHLMTTRGLKNGNEAPS